MLSIQLQRWVGFLLLSLVVQVTAIAESPSLHLNLRRQVAAKSEKTQFTTENTAADWPAEKTAIVICDMWDDHYCRASARRVAEMAPQMNRVIVEARKLGALIIHCPSGCMDKYAGMPQRELARRAPTVETKIPLKNWCYLDAAREPPLPIEDSEPCDDVQPREKVRFYTRQIESLEIHPQDAITDNAEAYYLMRQRGIEHVIVLGVHTNMCVLGRPFGIRQLTYQGLDVVLMRDMTDCMYDAKQKPYVDHFTGLDLIIEHIERHWCPTITSTDIIGGHVFRFAEDTRDVDLNKRHLDQ